MSRARFALLSLSIPVLFSSVSWASAPPVTEWRWVGVKPGSSASCPKPLGPWDASEIFKTAPAGYALENVCIFTYSGGGPVSGGDLVSLQALVTSGDLLAVERDLMALGSSGSSIDESLWQPLASYFLDQAGGGDLQTVFDRPPVRLAVLDTHPTADSFPLDRPANSEHGQTLIAMAERLLCGGLSVSAADCVAQITSRLALPYVSYDANDPAGSVIDLQYGGYVGTLTDLAAAIQMEVAAWERQGIPNQALVLNLSVGWNPDFGGLQADPADMPLPARLVFEAIADATCRGAVVVAATGNRSGGPGAGVGPMLPAAWASRSVPAKTRCDGATPDTPPPPSGNSWLETERPPLLFAAGGIQANGAMLTNSRPSSVPARVALGDHGVVGGPEHGEPTAILTGSSVSSLVVAAAAAGAWYYAPEVSGHQIMLAVDSSGEPLAMRADFCWTGGGSQCPTARRVSVCAAAEAACAVTGQCPQLSCSAWDPTPPDLSESLQTLVPLAHRSLSHITEVNHKAEVCEPLVSYFDPVYGQPVDPCPDRQYKSIEATPWVHPQPGTHTCPPCRIHRGGEQLIIQIDDDVTGELSEPTLELCGSTYSLGDIPLSPGATTVVDDVDASGCDEATVSFTVTDADNSSYSSINSALIVD